MAERHQREAGSGPGAAETAGTVSQDPRPVSEALRAATEAVRGCNVRWATAIDDPEIVARAALAAAEPLIRAEVRESIRVSRPGHTAALVAEARAPAVALLEEALRLRMNATGTYLDGQRWRKWDRECETYLRSLAPGGQP